MRTPVLSDEPVKIISFERPSIEQETILLLEPYRTYRDMDDILEEDLFDIHLAMDEIDPQDVAPQIMHQLYSLQEQANKYDATYVRFVMF